MKIESPTPASPTNVMPLQGNSARAQADTAADTSAASGSGSPTKTSGANVSLSALSTNLLSLGSSNSDDIDLTRVNAIRTALANGSLQVNPGKIADGMLQSVRDVLKAG